MFAPLVLRMVRAVVIQGTIISLRQICQQAGGARLGPTVLFTSGLSDVGNDVRERLRRRGLDWVCVEDHSAAARVGG